MGKPETIAAEAEVVTPEEDAGSIANVPQDLTQDRIQAIIDMAERTEALGNALDKIRKFILARALPGDFVVFREIDKQTGEAKEGRVELIGAGSDRIATALGISFKNWSDEKVSWTDKKGSAYTWRYYCDVHWAGRIWEKVEGRASSRDLFFGYAHGNYKPLEDIKEGDIRAAARHNCSKEGIKLILGLRGIPESACQGLGLDPSKIRAVEFNKAAAAAIANAKVGEDGGYIGILQKPIKKKEGVKKKSKWIMYSASLDSGVKASYFDGDKDHTLHEKVTALVGKKVHFYVEKNGKYMNLMNVKEFEEPKAEEKPPAENKPPAEHDNEPMEFPG